jgi:hypothetical protein
VVELKHREITISKRTQQERTKKKQERERPTVMTWEGGQIWKRKRRAEKGVDRFAESFSSLLACWP